MYMCYSDNLPHPYFIVYCSENYKIDTDYENHFIFKISIVSLHRINVWC